MIPPTGTLKLKKRILRAAIHEILVQPCHGDSNLEVTIHWQGGDHTRIFVKRPSRASGKAHDTLEDLVRQLAQELMDPEIARILNMKKLTTPGGLPWTKDRVRDFRRADDPTTSLEARGNGFGRSPHLTIWPGQSSSPEVWNHARNESRNSS